MSELIPMFWRRESDPEVSLERESELGKLNRTEHDIFLKLKHDGSDLQIKSESELSNTKQIESDSTRIGSDSESESS